MQNSSWSYVLLLLSSTLGLGGGVSRAAKSLSFLSEMHFALIPWFIEVGTVSGSEEEMCAVAAVAKQRICLSVLEKILRLKNFSYLLDFGLCQSSESSVTLNVQQNFGRFFRSLLKQQTLVLDDQIVAVCACVPGWAVRTELNIVQWLQKKTARSSSGSTRRNVDTVVPMQPFAMH